ncbi:Uncharacterised protein [Priestia megaterium]|uniref:zinc-ribbon domain-containing protein n=1 Tax=Priestia megaterium TaxID=1404 RepID=UPI000E17ECB4|nr:zinc-ribbon domain-containing protein [Priestia megaterium]SUV06410.1 Uncharacterised protein [Priestia megaterium]
MTGGKEKLFNRKESKLLAIAYPKLILEWDIKKNHLNPYIVTYGSSKKVWWVCPKCRNSYKSSINNRTSGRGCPFCAGKKVSSLNSIENNFEELLEEWDYEANNVSPREVTIGSKREIYWKCCRGHRWKARVYNRTKLGTGCPYCVKKKEIIK